MLWDNDRIKARFTVPGNIQGDISDIGFQGFLTGTVPAIISRLFLNLVLLITKVIIQLCFKHTFYSLLIEI